MGDRLDVIDELERRLLDACYRRPSWRQRVLSPRTWVPATALSAAAGVATAIVLLAGGGVSPSLAQAALNRAARAAASAPSTALVPGRDWYVRALITSTWPLPLPASAQPSPLAPSQRVQLISHTLEEVWMARDGSSHVRARTSFAFTDPRVAARQHQRLPRPQTEIIGSPRNGLLSSPLSHQRLISYRQLRALPASVAGLSRVLAQIEARLPMAPLPMPAQAPAAPLAAAPPRVSRNAFDQLRLISWLLAMPVTAPVRAALYRTAASIRGVHYDGASRDPLGRRGVAISLGFGGARLRMIFDPKTGELLSTATSYRGAGPLRRVRALVETLVAEKIVPDASRPASTRARRRG